MVDLNDWSKYDNSPASTKESPYTMTSGPLAMSVVTFLTVWLLLTVAATSVAVACEGRLRVKTGKVSSNGGIFQRLWVLPMVKSSIVSVLAPGNIFPIGCMMAE